MPYSNKIGILFFARLQAVQMGLVGLILGILYSFGGAIIDIIVSIGWVTSSETPGLSYGTALAFLALIGMPSLFAIFGFVYGIIVAILYNFASGIFGASIGKLVGKIEIKK
jgi:hypothetical protein